MTGYALQHKSADKPDMRTFSEHYRVVKRLKDEKLSPRDWEVVDVEIIFKKRKASK